MKLGEVATSGVTDNEALDEHTRLKVEIGVAVSFAHDNMLNDAFKQLVALPSFKAELEQQFLTAVRKTVSAHVKSSSIEIGHGWTDDYELEAQVVRATSFAVK